MAPHSTQYGADLGAPISVTLDYPTSSNNRSRYGFTRPVHPGTDRVLRGYEQAFRAELGALWGYREDLLAIPLEAGENADEPYWRNDWISGTDAAALYGYVRMRRPERYVEIGSGMSTRWAARAKRDGHLDTRIISIDPWPRLNVDHLCDEVIRAPLEAIDVAFLADLGPNDVVFMDCSHRAFMNSDVTVFYLEVLPSLRPGVLVGIDDIWWPEDYPSAWADRYYNEQYLLGAYLIAGCPWLEPVLSARYAYLHQLFRDGSEALWGQAGADEQYGFGLTFWARISERAVATDHEAAKPERNLGI